MSKIIFLMPPAYGHLNPGLPVLKELSERGEQVICYNTEEFRSAVERTGAGFRPYPSSELTSTKIAEVLRHGNLASATGLILQGTEQLLPFVLDELGHEKPNLVVFDSIAVWGRMAATRLRLPAAASISHLVMDEAHMTWRDKLHMLRQSLPKVPGILRTRRRLIRRYGNAYPMARPLFPMRSDLNIVFTIRDLQPDTPILNEGFRFVGPSIDPQTRSEDFPLDALGSGRVVYISLGTVHSAGPEFIKACFEAFAASAARFVFSVGRQFPLDELSPVPANFIVRPSVPQLEVLQRAGAFITHGGINSVHEGLYYGVPLILIPHQFEQLLNARQVAAHGAGLILEARMHAKPLTAASLRQSLEAVLAGPGYRQSAEVLGHAMRASGGYREAADHLQGYASVMRN
jgi:MGT family glycosyltransferase